MHQTPHGTGLPPRFLELDFHTHTELCGESQAHGFTIEQLFQRADQLGLRYVAYTEHWHPSTTRDLFLRIREEVERLQPRHRVKVFVSAEVDILNSRGDVSCDLADAASILDFVAVSPSHYGLREVEQLLPDIVDDTVGMILAACRMPEVTMIMHPQIAYGKSVADIADPIPPDVYDAVASAIADAGKVVDFPSVDMSIRYLHTLEFNPERIAAAEQSFRNFAEALVRHNVLLAPGSDAHNTDYWDGSGGQWFGNNQGSWDLLQSCGFRNGRLWSGPGSIGPM